MKKIMALPALLCLIAVSSQAANTSCLDNWEGDHSLNYQGCASAQTPAEERGQTTVDFLQPRIAVTNYTSSLITSQKVLCSQCHQNSMQMGHLYPSKI